MSDRITDKPPVWRAEPWGDVPPWERPGGFRLDAEPHRGEELCRLGNVAATMGALSLFPLCSPFCAPFALALGLATWCLASGDLRLMRRGLMDPRGEGKTEESRQFGRSAVSFGLVGAALALLWIFLVRWR
jgi:hypothetical protein